MCKRKLIASTIVETIVAMLIIMIISGIGLSTFLSVTKNTMRIQKIHAYNLMTYHLYNLSDDSHYGTRTIKLEDVDIEIIMKEYAEESSLTHRIVEVSNKEGQAIIVGQYIIDPDK